MVQILVKPAQSIPIDNAHDLEYYFFCIVNKGEEHLNTINLRTTKMYFIEVESTFNSTTQIIEISHYLVTTETDTDSLKC